MSLDVFFTKQSPKDVEVLFERHLVRLAIVVEIIRRKRSKVLNARERLKVFEAKRLELGKVPNIFMIDEICRQPIVKGRIGFECETEGFLNVPSGKVEIVVANLFDDIPPLFDAEVPIAWHPIDKAHVVVAGGRFESPSSAARLDRKQTLGSLVGKEPLISSQDLVVCHLGVLPHH